MVKKEICYYGPQDLLDDYKLYGNPRLSFVSQIFPKKYMNIAQKLGSDQVSFKEKNDIMESKMYRDFLSIPAGAYTRKRFQGPLDNIKWYVASNNILNRREIESFVEEVEESDDEFNDELVTQNWQEKTQEEISLSAEVDE